jgi:hypothetical protein
MLEFSYIGSSLQCFNENENCEEVVIEQVAENHLKIAEGQEIDDITEHEGSKTQIVVPSWYRLRG